MAQQRRTRAAKPAEEPAPEVVPAEDAPQDQPPAEPPAIGVFVSKERGADGGINVNVAPVGVEITEVQTILEIGLRSFREQIGLGRPDGR